MTTNPASPDGGSTSAQPEADVRPIRNKRPCAECEQHAADVEQLRGALAAVDIRAMVWAGIGIGLAIGAVVIAVLAWRKAGSITGTGDEDEGEG